MDTQTKLYATKKMSDNELVAIHKNKVTLTLYKTACIGICVLEVSKVLMYECHYDYIKDKHGNDSRLLCTHSGRLIYENKTKKLYKTFTNDK